MRLLHTADWHLGHRLYDQDRSPEHEAALEWLLETIRSERVDVLIVAGDIFDVTNPSNQARRLYYKFLSGLLHSPVQAAVIVGGNHDSPSMLDAPAEVLESLNVHVVGCARPQVQSQVVRLRLDREAGGEELIVAAVPFLRERDVRKSAFGESSVERISALREGILQHYLDVAAAAEEARTDPATPIVATGHLFAGGANDADDKKSHIYQADENNIDAGSFPACFDYVALGHVHRAQSVGERDKVRYSGSLIPLTFLEGQRPRSVRIVDIGGAGEPITSRKLFVPYARALLRLHGTIDEVKAAIRTAVVDHQANSTPNSLTPWAEVRVRTDDRIPNLNEVLQQTVEEATGPDHPSEVIRFVRRSQEPLTIAPAAAHQTTRQLDELDPEDVFKLVCETEALTSETSAAVLDDFRALRNWWQDKDSAA